MTVQTAHCALHSEERFWTVKRPFVMIGNVQLDVGDIGINGVGINGTGICVFGFDPSVACKKASAAPDDALSPKKHKTL